MAELPENRLPGFGRARDVFRRAALEVPAYADFLRRHKVVAERIRTPQDFARRAARDQGELPASLPVEHARQAW